MALTDDLPQTDGTDDLDEALRANAEVMARQLALQVAGEFDSLLAAGAAGRLSRIDAVEILTTLRTVRSLRRLTLEFGAYAYQAGWTDFS